MQKPSWFIEVKWTDRPFTDHKELNNCIEFRKKNPDITVKRTFVTSKTIDDQLEYRGDTFEFKPASLYAYTLGFNLLQHKEI